MVKLNDPVFASTSQLQAYSQKPIDLDNETAVAQAKAALCAGEQAVAAWMDAQTLVEHQVTVTGPLSRPKPTIEVDDGPITTINSVTVGGTVLDPSTVEIFSNWAILRNDNLFPEQTTIVLDYLAGYRVNSDGTTTMPPRIIQAILEVATIRQAQPDTGLIRERIGDWAGERADPGAGGQPPALPATVQSLLAAYRRPVT
jgi:hypothetical protein